MAVPLAVIVAIALAYCIPLTLFTEGTCIALHNNLGLNNGDLSMTTALGRKISGNLCPTNNGKPCHVYLTLGESAYDVFINFHVNTAVCNGKCSPFVTIDGEDL